MNTPTYQLINATNQNAKNLTYFQINNYTPNFEVAIQLIPTAGTGQVSYTVYQTAFQATGPISGQPLEFDINDVTLKYWTPVGTASSTVNQYINVTSPATALRVVAVIAGNATLEYSILVRGMQ